MKYLIFAISLFFLSGCYIPNTGYQQNNYQTRYSSSSSFAGGLADGLKQSNYQSRSYPNTTVNSSSFNSVITNSFNGFNHGNLFQLQNGQIWRQTEYYIWTYVWTYPKVFIYQEGFSYKMKVENIDHAVAVELVR